MQLLQRLSGVVFVSQQGAFGDLENEIFGRESVALDQRLDLVRETRVQQVDGREVDGNVEGDSARLPVMPLAGGSLEHEAADLADQSCLCRRRYELARGQEPASRVLPAHERLCPPDGTGREIGLRLIVDSQLP